MRLTPRNLLEEAAFWAYTALWCFLLPLLTLYLAVSPRHRPVLARLRVPVNAIPRHALWIHACSVGEVNAARPLLAALHEQLPECPLLLTVSTRSGQAHAAATLPDIPRAWFPLDHPLIVHRFFQAAQPRALVLIETELWPSVLRAANARAIPVILANGRLSDRHFDRYRRISWLVRPMMRAISAAAMQSARDAERVEALGLEHDCIEVMGNLKFDGAHFEVAPEIRERVEQTVRPDPERPLIVLGSARPGDEARAVAAWSALRAESPYPQLIIALRHPERIAEAERDCAGHPTRRRSACTMESPWRGEEILLVDTLGELLALYERATVVIIGGSFDANLQGHNPIEAAALGKPVIFGPHMRNFEEAAKVLLAARAAQRVSSSSELSAVLHGLLHDAAQRDEMGEVGRAAVLAQQGATARTATRIAQTVKNA